MRKLVLPAVLVLLAAAPPLPAGAGGGPPRGARELGEFKVTYYWMEIETDHPGPADTPLLDAGGREIARVPKRFADRLAIEGTGKLRDGRVVNYAGRDKQDGTIRYSIVRDPKAPYGYGVKSIPLVPFRSIAVDRSVVEIGAKLYIAEADGLPLPGAAAGVHHDGLFEAHDVGGGIQGRHIDIFIGTAAERKKLDLKKPKVKVWLVPKP